MGLLVRHDFLYAVAAAVSMAMGVGIVSKTLTKKEKSKAPILVWVLSIVAYFIVLFSIYQFIGPTSYDYYLFFGWILFQIVPAVFLCKDSISAKFFSVVMASFLACVTSFISGTLTTVLSLVIIKSIDIMSPNFMIPFICAKIIVSLITYWIYMKYSRDSIINVFQILEGKMGHYVPVPFISAIGFFFISQIVQKYGLYPTEGVFFAGFYLIVCVTYGVMYWLIFSNVSWSSQALRASAELNVASNIQRDMLPSIFPAFPERDEFDIYATMDPAKEVGGDFYDFFLVGDRQLAIVIADVSGKGIPAALFMVIAKTIIKNHAQQDIPLGEVFTQANQQLCDNNGEGLFVTAFMGLVNLDTGHFSYVNAGHNMPLIKKKNGNYEWLKMKPGFVLAGLEGMKYKEAELYFEPGDKIFLYTDGVTESLNTNKDLFGDPKLIETLNRSNAKLFSVQELLPYITEEIIKFADGAEQADDITMLALEYHGSSKNSILMNGGTL